MKKNLFIELEKLLQIAKPQDKFQAFEPLYKEFLEEKLDLTPTNEIIIFKEPSYKDFCNIVDPKNVPLRKNLESDEGRFTLLHAIAHIEYSAVDLALDACYRFQDMPFDYYKDWMEVADDEIRHFNMITELLSSYNITYGDLDVHQGLFDASMKTLDIIPRMALIPRYMEANGLDANAMMIEKLKKFKNTEKIISLLEIILEEEIDHVKKGDRWYKFACGKKENFTCDYFKIVNKVYPNSFKTNKNVNIEARKKAGFSEEEIQKLLEY